MYVPIFIQLHHLYKYLIQINDKICRSYIYTMSLMYIYNGILSADICVIERKENNSSIPKNDFRRPNKSFDTYK